MSDDKETEPTPRYERTSWDFFLNTGLLWMANSVLHVFGWVIVVAIEDDGTSTAYPARLNGVTGFDRATELDAKAKIANHMMTDQKRIAMNVLESQAWLALARAPKPPVSNSGHLTAEDKAAGLDGK